MTQAAGVGIFLAYRWVLNSCVEVTTGLRVLPKFDGVAYFERPEDVVDLSKVFFHLDDDQDFKPSLWHHGV